MRPSIFLLAQWVACLALGGVAQAVNCPSSCQGLFARLEDGIQEVQVQLRGEPKSGTGTIGEWAWGGLIGTCLYLRSLYGDASCRVNKWDHKAERYDEIVFEPALMPEEESAPCSCTGVTRVVIGFSRHAKHTLPVSEECPYHHKDNIPKIEDGVCHGGSDLPVESAADLWRCVEEARCTFNDRRLQLAVMRDPRAVAVSAYFHNIREYPKLKERLPSVDEYFQQHLGLICRWTTLRYLLFTKLLAHQSQLFHFEDMQADPVDWYGRFLFFVGLNLPVDVVFGLAQVASEGGDLFFGVQRKGVDKHPGSVAGQGSRRTFRDELQPESLDMMDGVLRALLPPVLLKRFGVDAP